jgi:XTP/dITP diphosphohydrolase
VTGHDALPDGVTLVLATTNRGKRDELVSVLREFPVGVRAIDEVLAGPPRVDEDGATFAANALKKARAAADATGMLSLADDSGLEVDALDGRPGVRSARFAREGATDAENNAALLSAIAASGRRPPFAARFRCVLALVDPRPAQPGAWTVEGVCEGTIALEPRGSFGFGYDPLFQVAGTGMTLAELDRDAKNAVSHRGRALAALRPLLAPLLGGTGEGLSTPEEVGVNPAPDGDGIV